MQKWEYCAVVGRAKNDRKLHPTWPAVWHFTINGVLVHEIKSDEASLVAKAIAQLGEEGWEAFGTGSTGGGSAGNSQNIHVMYFKRPKP
jgi:hypothetical protein